MNRLGDSRVGKHQMTGTRDVPPALILAPLLAVAAAVAAPWGPNDRFVRTDNPGAGARLSDRASTHGSLPPTARGNPDLCSGDEDLLAFIGQPKNLRGGAAEWVVSVERSVARMPAQTRTVRLKADSPACRRAVKDGGSYLFVFTRRNASENDEPPACLAAVSVSTDGHLVRALERSAAGLAPTLAGTVEATSTSCGSAREPVRGASVSVSAGGAVYTTTTGQQGEFEFLGLIPGVYSLQAEHPDYMPGAMADPVRMPLRGCRILNVLLFPR